MPATEQRSPSCGRCHGPLEESAYGGFIHVHDQNDATHQPVLMECEVCLEPLQWFMPGVRDLDGHWRHLRNDLEGDHDPEPREAKMVAVPPPAGSNIGIEGVPAMGWLRGELGGGKVDVRPKRRAARWLDSRSNRMLVAYLTVLAGLIVWSLVRDGVVATLVLVGFVAAIAGIVLAGHWWSRKAPRP